MKKQFSIGLIAMAAIMPAGCSDESSALSDGRGKVNLALNLDSSVTVAGGHGRAAGDITVDDLRLKMTSADGSYTKSWNSPAEFNAESSFSVGTYTLEAYYGDADNEDFDAPCYHGAADVTVTDGGNAAVSLTASLANSMVTVEYTEAFRNYFTSYGAQLHSAGGAYLEYAADETRAAYIKPGNCDIIINITKPNGTSATLQPTSFTAKPRTHHRVTMDVNNGQVGDAVLSITFDETVLDGEPVDIELSDELMNAPAPVVTSKGFDSGMTMSLIEGSEPANPVRANIVARGGLAEVTLTTQSRSLIQQGWPAEIDLMSADDARRSALTALGFSQLGLWGNADKMASIDLTGVISHIAYLESGANTSTFTLQVKDRYGKVLEQPVTLNVNIDKLRLELTNPSEAHLGDTSIDVDLIYNGDDITDVTMYAGKASGTYAPADYMVLSHDGDTYRLRVTVPTITQNVHLRARCGNHTGDIIAQTFPFELTCSDNDVFATHATVSITGINEPSADIAARATLYVSTDGTDFVPVTATRDGADFNITGLVPGTEYHVRATVDGRTNNATTFTTEAAAQLPNSDMERWHSIKVYDKKPFGKDIYQWFACGENDNSFWATRNALTTATRNGTAPYYVAYSGTVSTAGKSGLAAEISSLGYGEGSTFTNGGGICKHKAAGMLFIGEHSASSETDETVSYGRPFTSRPESFSFQYKYAPYDNESFKAYIVIENRDNGTVELGRGEMVSGESKGDFTKATVKVNYSDLSLKATHMYIVFLSSTADTPSVRNVKGSDGAFQGYADARRIGSVLTVDDIKLNY